MGSRPWPTPPCTVTAGKHDWVVLRERPPFFHCTACGGDVYEIGKRPMPPLRLVEDGAKDE